MTAFDPGTLRALAAARTVRIETSAGDGAPAHQAPIWIVVDDAGRVLVRSWRGARGRWYRELLANPRGAVIVAGQRIPVRAEPAADADRVEACSRGLRRKYASARASLASMLVPEVVEHNLELRPTE